MAAGIASARTSQKARDPRFIARELRGINASISSYFVIDVLFQSFKLFFPVLQVEDSNFK
jgi:hypothetical protein